VPLPEPGQFRCADLRPEDVRAPGADVHELGVGVLIDADGRGAARGLLPSMQLFQLTAGGAEPVRGGDWIGRGADKFFSESAPSGATGAACEGPGMACEAALP
jgi:hypothetical protein